MTIRDNLLASSRLHAQERRLLLNILGLGLCIAAVVTWTGCSELIGDDQVLTCQWLASNNCWKQALAQANSCVPSGTGTFDASRQVCSYPSGGSINFSSSVSFDTNNQWSYSVSNGGSCLSFDELGGTGRSFRLTTQLGDVVVEESGLSLSVSCPDGSSYATTDTSMLFDTCDDGFQFLPDFTEQVDPSRISFALTGGSSGSVPVFSCQ